jgi:hypothetical protein
MMKINELWIIYWFGKDQSLLVKMRRKILVMPRQYFVSINARIGGI